MIRLSNGERGNMVNLKTINEVAIRWNKTKDPKDKDLWYKLIREYGLNNTKRRNVSSNSGNERNVGESDDNRQGKLF